MQIPAPAPEQLFEYFDGVQIVRADPWPLHRAIFRQTHGQPNALTKHIYAVKDDTTDTQTLMDGYDAMDQLESLVREIFAMKPFDPATGQGAQWPHCFAVWEQFATYMTEQKKKTGTTPTSTSPSGSPQASIQATPPGSV